MDLKKKYNNSMIVRLSYNLIVCSLLYEYCPITPYNIFFSIITIIYNIC